MKLFNGTCLLAAATTLLASVAAKAPLTAQSPIVMDGLFEDWTDIPGITDSSDPDAVDLLEMKVTNDETYLYVYLRVAEEIKLTEALIPQSIFLQIDVDVDAATGYLLQEGFGSELGIDFADHFAYYNVDPDAVVNFYDIGFHPAPTVSGTEYELAIRRDAVPDGVHPLFPNDDIRIMFRETIGGDKMPNVGEEFIYTFSDDVRGHRTLGLGPNHPCFRANVRVQCPGKRIDGRRPATAF